MTVPEVNDATLIKSKPYATLQRISGQSPRQVLMSGASPRNSFDNFVANQTKKTVILVGDPQIACRVLRNAMHYSAGNPSDRNQPVIFQIADPITRAHPDSPAIILK